MSNAEQIATAQLKVDEGLRLKMYRCPANFNTVGYGFNLDANPITEEIAEALLEIKVKDTVSEVSKYPYWNSLNGDRKAVLINLCYCVGPSGFSRFKRMHAALEISDWEQAAVEILDSAFASQTGDRAKRLATAMKG
jgi:lysozyme